MNLEKEKALVEEHEPFDTISSQIEIINAQSRLIDREDKILIISTCGFFFPEYNASLLENED